MDRRSFLAFLGIAATTVHFETFPFSALASSANALDRMRPERFKRFAAGEPTNLFDAKGFEFFIKSRFPSVICPFAKNLSLYQSVRAWAAGGSIELEHNRYLFVKGYMQRVWNNRMLLWMDTSTRLSGPTPPTIACFLTFNAGTPGLAGGSSRSLWIFSSQALSSWRYGEPPHHLRMTLDRWLRSRKSGKQDLGLVGNVVVSEPAESFGGENPATFGIRQYRLTPQAEVLHWTSQGLHAQP